MNQVTRGFLPAPRLQLLIAKPINGRGETPAGPAELPGADYSPESLDHRASVSRTQML